MTESTRPPLLISEGFADALQASINQYGEPITFWAWQSFMPALLPFAEAKFREQKIVAAAQQYGLSDDQIEDAFRLYAAAVASENPHAAWQAGEALLRIAPQEGVSNLLAALGPAANKVVA